MVKEKPKTKERDVKRGSNDFVTVVGIDGEHLKLSRHDVQKLVKARAVRATGPRVTSETSAAALERSLAERMINSLDLDTDEIKPLVEKYSLKREELGRLTGFSLRALADWNSGKLPSDPARRRLREVHRLLDALSNIVDPRSIPSWLHKRNPAFDNMTPLQVIELGEIDRLWQMIYQIGSGYLD